MKQAYQDYIGGDKCPLDCRYKNDCDEIKINSKFCAARDFIHSAWAAAMCDGVDIDHQRYVRTCIEKHRLTKNAFRYIESELKQYKSTLKELTQLKEDIILSTPEKQEVRGNDVGDPTLNKMLKISLSRKIMEMEKTVKAVEKVHKSLFGEKRRVMEEYWNGKYTVQGMAYEFGVDERTIRRWKRFIVYSVAIELKYL